MLIELTGNIHSQFPNVKFEFRESVLEVFGIFPPVLQTFGCDNLTSSRPGNVTLSMYPRNRRKTTPGRVDIDPS